MANRNHDKKNAGGRPLSYDPNLVREIIAAGISKGVPADELDATFVKETLCSEHGVKGSIRLETLESLVDAAHAEIEEAEKEALLGALPDEVAPAVHAAVAAAGQDLLLVVARQHAAAKSAAGQVCEELRADKRNAQHRLAALEGDLAEEKRARSALERECKVLERQLADAHQQLHEARHEVERLRREPTGIDRLLAELRDPANRDDIRATLSEISGGSGTPS